MSAAGGAPPGARDRAWSRFDPSISRRRVAASGSRSGWGIDAIVRVSRGPATIGRWASSCSSTSTASSIAARTRPGCRRGPCRSRVTWRRRRVRDQQLDALPARLPDPPRRDGRTGHARDRRLVGPRDGRLPARPRPGDPARARPRRQRARARAARRGLRRRHLGRRRDEDEPGADRRLHGGRPARRRRRRARPEPDLCPARRGLGLDPGRRPLHRHQPRPGLPVRARPAARCRLAGHRPRGRHRRRPGARSGSPRRTCSRRPPTPWAASRPRRS